jgi:hypothetical protein
VSISRSKRPARGLARFLVPALALMFFLSPIIPTPAESAGGPPYHLYLPLTLLPWGELEGPSLQIDQNGAVYVIWPADEFDEDSRIYFDWRAPITGDATDPTRWHDDEVFVKFYIAESQGLAAGPDGNLIAVWTQRSPALGELPLRKICAATRP